MIIDTEIYYNRKIIRLSGRLRLFYGIMSRANNKPYTQTSESNKKEFVFETKH